MRAVKTTIIIITIVMLLQICQVLHNILQVQARRGQEVTSRILTTCDLSTHTALSPQAGLLTTQPTTSAMNAHHAHGIFSLEQTTCQVTKWLSAWDQLLSIECVLYDHNDQINSECAVRVDDSHSPAGQRDHLLLLPGPM